MTEQRIRVTAQRVRIADVCVIRASDPEEAVTVMPSLLCIEIFSPEDRIPRARRVLEDYHAMGVPTCWLIDPIQRVAYLSDGEGFRPSLTNHAHLGRNGNCRTNGGIIRATGLLKSTERLELAGTPLSLPLYELFARLD